MWLMLSTNCAKLSPALLNLALYLLKLCEFCLELIWRILRYVGLQRVKQQTVSTGKTGSKLLRLAANHVNRWIFGLAIRGKSPWRISLLSSTWAQLSPLMNMFWNALAWTCLRKSEVSSDSPLEPSLVHWFTGFSYQSENWFSRNCRALK